MELPVLQSRPQCLQLLFLFEVSPLVQPANASAVLTHKFATSSNRCLIYCIYRLTPAELSALYSAESTVTCVFCYLKTAELTPPELSTLYSAESTVTCVFLPEKCEAYPGGAVCPVQCGIYSNVRVFLPENCGAWRHKDRCGRQCHLAAVCVIIVTSGAFLVLFTV